MAPDAPRPHGVRLAWLAARRGVANFYNSRDLTFASSIAYYSLLSLFPFVLLLLKAFGWMAGGMRQDALVDAVGRTLPSHFDFIVSQIDALAAHPPALGLNTIVLLWASMGVFGAITYAINYAWRVVEPPGFFKHKLIAFIMLMLAGLLTLAGIALMGLSQVIGTRWFSGVPTPLFMLVVGSIYYFVPIAKVRLRDVWLGAVIAGGLWRLAFAGFSWYLSDLSLLNSVHGSIAAVVVFLIWVYVSAVILLYGAEVSAEYARLRSQ